MNREKGNKKSPRKKFLQKHNTQFRVRNLRTHLTLVKAIQKKENSFLNISGRHRLVSSYFLSLLFSIVFLFPFSSSSDQYH